MRHFIKPASISDAELARLLALADELRGKRELTHLRGKSVVLVFFNPSLRTRVSMEVAVQELGGRVVSLDVGQGVWSLEEREGVVMDQDKSEHVKEAARVLSRYGDMLAVRAFPKMRSWEEDREERVMGAFERYATVPVVNLESTLYHPCQGLADILTVRRAFPKSGPKKIVLSWANHPKALPVAVPTTFALCMTRMGWPLTIARPEGYDLPAEVMAECAANAAKHGSALEVTEDREAALRGAQVVYAKSWGRTDRYGEPERELAERKDRGLSRWIIDEPAMALTDDARFMHCLPVRRNVVVADAVLDGPRTLVYDQAENRLHAQKALLAMMIGGQA